MSLSIGIVGLPNVGKSTLFNALSHNQAVAANYPFATIDPNVGVVSVPDRRLEQLGGLYPAAPVVPTDITFTDIAGLVAGASQGEGLGNQFLANIREVSAIVHVVRAFEDANVQHVSEEPDPTQDIETINTELVLADLATLSKRKEALAKPAKNDPGLQRDIKLVDELLLGLDNGRLITEQLGDQPLDAYLENAQISHDTATLIRQLLSAKPMVYVFNVDEATIRDQKRQAELARLVAPGESVCICAQLEAELIGLEPGEARELLGEYGQEESGLVRLIQAGYRALNLQSFFTAGDKEVKAWTVPAGSTAPQAAGTIHSDFQKGFIAAEIINWQELVEAGSRTAARTQGLLRTEGKQYVMRDGDVAEFRFNT